MAQDLLQNTDLDLMEISCKLGFSTQSHFIQAFKQLTGTMPKKYRTLNQHEKWIASKDQNDHERYPFLFE